MRSSGTLFVLVILVLSAVKCSEKSTESISEPVINRTTAELTPQEKSAISSSNKFGMNLFRELTAQIAATDNIFLSPLSVSYALALCYNGANGETREAIGSTLEMADLSLEELNQAYYAATKILMQADPEVDFRLANSFWSRQGKVIQPGFIDLAKTYFSARVEEIDFQAPNAADIINAWVEEATNGKITDMVEPPISASTAAMLFNAIYFKGSWMYEFDTEHTHDRTFHLADGTDTQCQMMYMGQEDCLVQPPGYNYPITDTNITMYEDNNVFVLGMPYGRGDFRMSIIIPNRWFGYPNNDTARSIDEVIAGLTPEKWAAWTSGGTPYEFDLALPKFKFRDDIGLTELLKALGMEIAFNRNEADFSNLFVDGVGWIDEVKQKTFIQVDEHGTEAAAVTQVVFADAVPPQIICDRPFLVVIHEDNSGAILFMGRIANPVWEE